jgi:excisionase family DNA binding protein
MTAPSFLSESARAELEAFVADVVAGEIERLVRVAPAQTSPYWTVAEGAEYLRCTRQRIYDLLTARRLTRVKEGRRTLLRRAEVEAYVGTGQPSQLRQTTRGPFDGGRRIG